MLEQTLKERMALFKNIYSQLYSSLKWKTDKRFLMLIAAMYVTNSKDFHLKRFLELADYIKNEVGMFSHLKSAHRFTTAAALDSTTADSKESCHHFINIYEKLIENGYSRVVYSYIAAGTLLKVEPSRIEEYVQKTIDVYNGMKDHHPFLTNSGDYPLAAILAQSEKNKDEIIVNVEDHYKALNEKGFSIGNDLQFLSHILALNTDQKPIESAERCLVIKNQLEEANFKSKRVYYPYIGMLSYLEKIESEIESLYEMYENLNNDKLFRWNKDVNFMLSVLFLMSQKTLLADAARTGLNTTIEILIQAQQAAMTASITAATAAASSSSGDS
ncbi:DUF4003 family protein [Bacillus canaveralius]|uniref:DUF4003 family protein n=1 Tax=Bacillus canaveralius TaxID=1403243 RepID=UPI000F79310D|nr:DUF4003 family protein [Bacillus canaveralius]RSK47434.1 DUF4003 domain-containing protein [Bacillus canaveralius]